jgi:hypothetical protein
VLEGMSSVPGNSEWVRARKGRKPAEGEKRQFLATMDPEVIKPVKLAAFEDETSASEILEEAATEWLERRKSKAKKS